MQFISITNITTNLSSNPLGLSMVSTCRHENAPNVAPQQPRPLSAALEEVLVLNYVFFLLCTKTSAKNPPLFKHMCTYTLREDDNVCITGTRLTLSYVRLSLNDYHACVRACVCVCVCAFIMRRWAFVIIAGASFCRRGRHHSRERWASNTLRSSKLSAQGWRWREAAVHAIARDRPQPFKTERQRRKEEGNLKSKGERRAGEPDTPRS